MMTTTTTLRFEDAYNKFVQAVPAEGRVLDLAYKQGIYAHLFIRKGFDVMAISARNSWQTPIVDNRIKMQCKSLEELSLPYRTFNGIWAADSLIGIARDQLSVQVSQFVDWLKVGGVLSFCMLEGEGYKVIKEQSPLGGVTEKKLVYYLPAQIENLLCSVGCPATEAWYESHGNRRFIQVLAKRES